MFVVFFVWEPVYTSSCFIYMWTPAASSSIILKFSHHRMVSSFFLSDTVSLNHSDTGYKLIKIPIHLSEPCVRG